MDTRITVPATLLALAVGGCVLVIDDELTRHRATDTGPASTIAHADTADDRRSLNHPIRVEAGHVAGHLESVNGSIRIGDRARARHVDSINGMVRIGAGAAVHHDVENVNGSIVAESGARIGGSVRSVNGRIRLDATHVAGTIESVNADLRTGRDSRIDRGIRYRAEHRGNGSDTPPTVIVDAGTVVSGTMRFERPVRLLVHREARIGAVRGAQPVYFDGDPPG